MTVMSAILPFCLLAFFQGCLVAAQASLCSSITTEATCTADDLCIWSQSCTELPTSCDEASESTCDLLGDQCVLKAECGPSVEASLPCLLRTEEGICDSTDGCTWYPALSFCYVDIDVLLQCGDEDTESKCGLAGCSWSQNCQENGCDVKQTEDDCVAFSGCYWGMTTGTAEFDYGIDDEVIALPIRPECNSCISNDDGLNYYKWDEAHAGETCTFTGTTTFLGVPVDTSGTAIIGFDSPNKNIDGMCDGGDAADRPSTGPGSEIVFTCTTTTTSGIHGTSPSLYVVAIIIAFALVQQFAVLPVYA